MVYSLTPVYNTEQQHRDIDRSKPCLGSGTLPAAATGSRSISNGTDTIHDLSGNALDGDSDGVAGGNFVRTFTLTGTAPTVTGISPAGGPIGGGTSVTISGANLAGVTAVMFGSTSVAVLGDTGTQITATGPRPARWARWM